MVIKIPHQVMNPTKRTVYIILGGLLYYVENEQSQEIIKPIIYKDIKPPINEQIFKVWSWIQKVLELDP